MPDANDQSTNHDVELTRIKTMFMTTISHEFRTPLATIMSSTELLQRYFERLTPTRRDECLTVIHVQVQHLKEILDDLSLLIAMDSDMLRYEPAVVSLRKVVQKVASRFDWQPFDWRSTFHNDLDWIQADENLLIPILRHLLSNAVRYSPQGSMITLELRRDAQHLLIEVADKGVGIPEDDIDHIFDTFYRGRNVHHIGGTGLGLAIVQRCVTLCGGSIACQSRVGFGTTFSVRLSL
jgi:signal transduction histidine kinase